MRKAFAILIASALLSLPSAASAQAQAELHTFHCLHGCPAGLSNLATPHSTD